MYRKSPTNTEVFLVHPGGPFWSNRNEGSWTIPKGQCEPGEQPLAAAIREFQEETGFTVAEPFLELGSIQQKSGKRVLAWAFEGDCNPAELISNTCEIEWPPRSGTRVDIPEVDRGDWFSFDRARHFIRAEQLPLLDALKSLLA